MSSPHVTSPPAVDQRLSGNPPNTPTRHVLRALTRLLNPLILRFAGSAHFPLFAQIHHRGRRSGRAYTTPVGARRTDGGFVVPLTFGEGADWFRNVSASGGCVIRWKGADYPVVAPQVITWAAAKPAFYPVERALVPVIGIKQFARLRLASVDRR